MIGKWHIQSSPTGFDNWQALIGQGPYYDPRFLTPGDTIQTEGYTTDIITDLDLNWLETQLITLSSMRAKVFLSLQTFLMITPIAHSLRQNKA